MKVTLQVDGRELSLEEVEAIVREYFSNPKVAGGKTTTQQEAKPIQRPTEGIPFPVNHLDIDRNPFQEMREDSQQERTRQLILEAFAMVDKNPKKYGNPFKTLMPKKTWDWKTVYELEKLATELGNHEADWVEQALEWAQRIANGETWEDICNKPDTANWYRLVKWQDGHRLVGGSREFSSSVPASGVFYSHYRSYHEIFYAVPLVVLRDGN